jgi:hypothetical protein
MRRYIAKIAVALGVIVFAWVGYSYFKPSLRVVLTDSEVQLMSELWKMSSESNKSSEVADNLYYLINRVSTHAQQEPGTPLYRIAETTRAAYIKLIIARLKTITGADYGDEASAWIVHYASPDVVEVFKRDTKSLEGYLQ